MRRRLVDWLLRRVERLADRATGRRHESWWPCPLCPVVVKGRLDAMGDHAIEIGRHVNGSHTPAELDEVWRGVER